VLDHEGLIVQNTPIEATIYYRHRQSEVARLNTALIPIHDQLDRCSSPAASSAVAKVLACRHFRVRDSELMCSALLKAAKQTRANLPEYFPMMWDGLIAAVEELENAVADYQKRFEELRHESLPVE
jgi:hypothetical protein